MGNIFKKAPKNNAPPQVSEQDLAVLQLKQLRDKIQQSQKRVDLQMSKDREMARTLLQNGNKERALLLLKKKKRLEKSMLEMDSKLQMLETMVSDIEFSQIQIKLVDGLKTGNEALKHLNSLLSIEDVESILEETKESAQKQKELSAILMKESFTDDDNQELEDELNELIGVQEDVSLPDVPEELPVEDEALRFEPLPGLKNPSEDRPKKKKEAIAAS